MKHIKRTSWAVLLLLCSVASYGGVIHNISYDTRCAEMDNINIPLTHTNTTAYRVVVTHPRYYPTSISEWGADFSECTFGGREIWVLGSDDGSPNEFWTNGFSTGDIYYAPDDPTSGIDEVVCQMPKEINNDWMYDQYIYFTADEDEDVNLEARIGSRFTIDMVMVNGTLELKVWTFGRNGWEDQGSQVFNESNLRREWHIPDLTWAEGTDTNIIHLEVIRECDGEQTTTNAWALYDYLDLRKRDEAGDNSSNPTVLYSGSNTIVETVHIDFWWRYPDAINVSAVGGGTDTNAHYLRIKRRMPDSNDFNEIFVLYEDGNARIIPFPPLGAWAVPYGASIILGPTTNSPRPFCEIESAVVDPEDLSIELTYGDGTTAHVELRADRERHIVDVSELTCNTTNAAFSRFRSMWVYDGKTDIDRVSCADGTFPIMDNWSALTGTWWQFSRAVPSYHNTYCPDFRVELMDPVPGAVTWEAESADWLTNASVITARTNASGDETVLAADSGGELGFTNLVLATDMPASSLFVRYAVESGGDGIDKLANTVAIVVDGVYTSETVFAVETGGTNEYEWMPSVSLGDLSAGTHELVVAVGAGTNKLELDSCMLVSQPSYGWIRKSLLTRQCETFDEASNYVHETRAGVPTIHLEHADSNQEAYATFDFDMPVDCSNTYLRLRYTDDVGPTRIRFVLDGTLQARCPSESTGGWSTFADSWDLFLGTITAGWHELRIEVSNETWGVDLDEFELFTFEDNQAPTLSIPGPHECWVGSYTGFPLTVADGDGDETTVTNVTVLEGALLDTNYYSWTALSAYGGTTNIVLFTADDGRGLTNSVVTNYTVMVVPFDADEDALADGWEWDSFATLAEAGDDDTDDDGADNYNEYITGTSPTNPGSVFTAQAASVPEQISQHEISVPTIPGRKYIIYYADDMTETISWSRFANTNNGVGCWTETSTVASVYTFLDDETAGTSGSVPAQGRRCYRVEVVQP